MRVWLLIVLALLSEAAFTQTRAMTYNIRNSHARDGVNAWAKRRDNLAALIKKVDPDILGTQEVLFNQLKDLKARLKDYTAYGVGRNDGKHAGEFSALFYKTGKYKFLKGGNFWLSETPNIPGSKSWDAALTRICTWVQLQEISTGKVFFVFNTHFDHKGVQARRNSADLLRRTIDSLANGYPVIVTGDFNFTPKDPAYQTMTSGNYKTGLSDSYTPGAPDYTDCGFSVANTKCGRIDYIYYSSQYTKSNYTLHTDNNGQYYPSDHCTISVELN
ncbi:MAG TPA: endonuclease/exonuclease/phosphatase family protein [Chitinophagales bacterium]|nr:endonuclease/exonuclease/phosphatase family protein [Chitinophagales bacterium]